MTHIGEPHQPSGRHARPRRLLRRALVVAVVAIVLVALVALVALPGLQSRIPVTPGHRDVAVPVSDTTGPAPGAPTVGSTSYPVPADSLFVSPSGSNSRKGSEASPYQTVQYAISQSHPGQTIVLRAGTYHQNVTVPEGTPVTIESYPNEAVWFDGSTLVSSWVANGSIWVSEGWMAQFDSSPTYTTGAPESTLPSFNFLNPKYPLAAHPDQVWIDDKPLVQVKDANAVKADTFAVDYAQHRLYLGSDPTGHEVRASDKTKALAVQAEGTVLRGFGVRRYATPLPGFGAVTIEAAKASLQDLDIEQNATTGLFLGAADAVLRNITSRDNGMIGVNANYADNLTIAGLSVTGNNVQRFNTAPVAGGMKITRSRDLTIEYSSFSHNHGPGLWFDQSVYDGKIISNTMDGNFWHGLSMEISSLFVVAGNTVVNNGGNGIKLNDTDNVQIWNNTVANNAIDLRVAQDPRRATDPTVPGQNPRYPSDPAMTWVLGNIVVSNNVFSGSSISALVSVQDYSGHFTAQQLGVTLNGNAYQRASASEPESQLLWEQGHNTAKQYTPLSTFRLETGQEKQGAQLANAPAGKRTWLTAASTSAATTDSRPAMPGSIMALLGWDASDHRVGAD